MNTRGIKKEDVQGKSLAATVLLNQSGIKGFFYHLRNAYKNINWGTVGIFKFSSQTIEMSYFMKYEKSEKITLLSNIFQYGLDILEQVQIGQRCVQMV